MSGPSTVLVDRHSATSGRPWESGTDFVYPVNESHSGIVKFRNKHDETYEMILCRLRDIQTKTKG